MMSVTEAVSVRPFLGSADFNISRQFYQFLGFKEVVLEPRLSLFEGYGVHFYLQDAYVKEWIENTMVFVELGDPEVLLKKFRDLNISNSFPSAKLSAMRKELWGEQFFLHDPAGNLWHFGCFKATKG